MLNPTSEYRSRIYAKYASGFQDAHEVFDERAAATWSKAYDYYLRGWLPQHKNAAIVDLACGGGKLLYFFKQRGYTRVSGVDISAEQVQIARQVGQDVGEENLLEFLGAHPGAFDLITGLDIVEHFDKDEVLRFLAGCFTALMPGGRLILQTPNADSPWGASIRYGDFTHEVCFNPSALTGLLRLSGFNRVEAREQGPVAWGYGLTSSARYLVWQVIRLGLKIYNLAETGAVGSGLFTRGFIISGCKP